MSSGVCHVQEKVSQREAGWHLPPLNWYQRHFHGGPHAEFVGTSKKTGSQIVRLHGLESVTFRLKEHCTTRLAFCEA